MTLKTNANRQSNVAFSCSERPVAGRARMLISGLRRAAHLPGDFLAGAILVPPSGDVNRNLEASADDFAWVTPDVNATAVVLVGEAVLSKANLPSGIGIAGVLDEDDEDEDEEDDDYDDDDLDEEDDEDLDDEDDAEFDDEDDLDDDDLDDDDLDDEVEEDDEE
jgi:hypothetical protein